MLGGKKQGREREKAINCLENWSGSKMDGAGLSLMANIARSPAGENHFIRQKKKLENGKESEIT